MGGISRGGDRLFWSVGHDGGVGSEMAKGNHEYPEDRPNGTIPISVDGDGGPVGGRLRGLYATPIEAE